MLRNVCNSVQNVPNSCAVTLFIDSALQFPPILESADCSVLPFISPFPFGSDKPKPPEELCARFPVATCSDLALSVRRHLFAAERERLLVFEFGCVAFELFGLLSFQPRLLVESRPSAYQPLVLLDIPSHRVDAPLISLDFEQLLQLR